MYLYIVLLFFVIVYFFGLFIGLWYIIICLCIYLLYLDEIYDYKFFLLVLKIIIILLLI